MSQDFYEDDDDWGIVRDPVKQAEYSRWDRMFVPTVPENAEMLSRKVGMQIDGFLPRGYVAILACPSKQGKTALATAMAYAVASGQPFAGQAVRQSPVLWLAYEENPYERAQYDVLIPRLPKDHRIFENKMIRKRWGDDFHKLSDIPAPVFTAYNPYPIDSEAGIECLDHNLCEYGAKFAVVDPLHGAVDSHCLAENSAARRLMKPLKRLAYERDCTILINHHLTKAQTKGHSPDRFADSHQILAAASMHIHMELDRLDDGTREITLTAVGRGAHACYRQRLLSTSLLSYEPLVRSSKRQLADDQILDLLTTNDLTAELLAERTGFKQGTIRNVLARLRREGKIELVSKDSAKYVYSLV